MDDNPADVKLMEELLSTCRFPVQLRVAKDGEEALKVLNHSSFDGKEDPDLILLDLNLPNIDGQEVLTRIKADRGLKHIPVFVLTGSNNQHDFELAQQQHADDYIIKVTGVKDFSEIVKRIEDFWLNFKGKMT